MADHTELAELPIFAPVEDAKIGRVRRDPRAKSKGWTPEPPSPGMRHALAPRTPSPMSRDDDHGSLDWGLVRALRQQAAKLLADQLRDRSVPAEQEREIGRDVIARLLDEHVDAQVRGGAAAGLFTPSEQDELARAVFRLAVRAGQVAAAGG